MASRDDSTQHFPRIIDIGAAHTPQVSGKTHLPNAPGRPSVVLAGDAPDFPEPHRPPIMPTCVGGKPVTPVPRKYYFQSWHRGDSLETETFYGNQAMARFLERRIRNLDAPFAQYLRITAATPTSRNQTRTVPRTIYITIRQGVTLEGGDEDVVIAFRDGHYLSLAAEYLRTLSKTLDFYKCYVEDSNGNILGGVFTTLRVTRRFRQRVEAGIRSPDTESLGDIAKGLADGALKIPPRAVKAATKFIRSRVESQNSTNQPGTNDAPESAHQGAGASHEPGQSSHEIYSAIQALFQWLTAQSEVPPASATAGTANSYIRWKSTARELINVLRPVGRVFQQSQEEGPGNSSRTSEISGMWSQLLCAHDSRHHGHDLILNLNQTGLLKDVLDRHTATKSAAYGLCAVGSLVGLPGGAYCVFGVVWWPLAASLVAGATLAYCAGSKSLEHWDYRERVHDMKLDFESFRNAWDDVAKTLALQFAISAGFDVNAQSGEIQNYFMQTLGLDVSGLAESQYMMTGLSLRVENLDRAFLKFTENVDWLDEKENLGLNRGVEEAGS